MSNHDVQLDKLGACKIYLLCFLSVPLRQINLSKQYQEITLVDMKYSLIVVTLRILLKTSIYHLFHIVDFILCRSCGHEILHPSAIIQVPSKVAHRQRNDTIAGRNGTLIQLFKNPDGI